ncbi:hypothetical protein ACSLBF_21355 (plasmid) [Pseudoalteromonas sp. T1lg65]|uniref:hypothetical protein n=1 Tax=Pseudoalteromonas sp. T1lg65 TaxID=2077101 RepID=UPI003F78BEB8
MRLVHIKLVLFSTTLLLFSAFLSAEYTDWKIGKLCDQKCELLGSKQNNQVQCNSDSVCFCGESEMHVQIVES